jgi:WS/DGAT/MGAT family acyltransferase
MPLAKVKAIGKLTGTTVNDVFLAVCAGALRRYLERSGELPEKPLIAGCPVSLRKPGDTNLNNQVSMMLVDCATNEADPVKRLLKIGKSAVQAKGLMADISESYDSDFAAPGLPGIMAGMIRAVEAGNLADLPVQLPCNVVISNVPGPREQMYVLGGRMLTHYPVSIPAHAQAVNITVQSYVDHMFFAVTGCARALPDADALRDDMLEAFLELKTRLLDKVPAKFQPREKAASGAPNAAENLSSVLDVPFLGDSSEAA